MKKAKRPNKAQKAAIKRRVGRGKPKGKPPAALRTKKAKRTLRAVAPLPREVGLLDAIGEVMAEITDLGQEMRDWADNMPESKQGGDKHSEVEGAADTLEGISDPVDHETMAFLNEIKVTIQDPTPRRRGYSRSARLGQATDVLNDVINKLEEFADQTQDADLEAIANDFRGELDNIESELQGVDFPGMYG
jgi:hypothetical protein